MRREKIIFFILVFLVVQSKASSNPAYRYSQDMTDHYESSKARVLSRFGISFKAYLNFFNSLNKNHSQKGPSALCVRSLSDSKEGRSKLLNCLSRYGRAGLNVNLFSAIYQQKWKRIQKTPTSLEIQKTKALLAYIEDLIREQLEAQGVNTSWWIPEKGFWTKGKNQGDFEYQDGDILLVIGNSSISALISQATYPQRRFSHALMVRMEDGKFKTLEALIEKGVTSVDRKYFSKETLQSVVVLRWKNIKQRHTIATRASTCGDELLKNKTPYNFSMNLKDTTKMFCSQLVAHCYSMASGKPVLSMIPQVSSIRSTEVFNYLKNLGVQSQTMPSPGDLASSEHFEVAAEFRRVRDNKGHFQISRLWDMVTAGDVFVDRLEIGQTFRFDMITAKLLRPLVDLVNFTLINTTGNIFGRDISILGGVYPEGIDTQTAGYMLVQEKLVFKPVWEQGIKGLKQSDHPDFKNQIKMNPDSLINVHPIYRRGMMSLEMNKRGVVSSQIFH